MNLFSDQLSAVRQAQWEAQLDMFRKLSVRALDSAGQIAALNVRTSQAAMEQAAGTMKHLFEVRQPRDLFALGSTAQGQWHTLFDYGRELFGIAVGARLASNINIPTSYSQAIEQAQIATADATTVTTEIAAAAVDTGAALAEAAIDAGNVARNHAAPQQEQAAAASAAEAEAAIDIDTAIADAVPPAEPKPVVKALSEVAPKPAGAEHPLASTVPLQAEAQADVKVELPALVPPVVAPKAQRGPRKK